MQAVTIRWWQRLWTTQVHTRKLNPQLYIYQKLTVWPVTLDRGLDQAKVLDLDVWPTEWQSVLQSSVLSLSLSLRSPCSCSNYSYSSPELDSSLRAFSLPVPTSRGIFSRYDSGHPAPWAETFNSMSLPINRVQISQPDFGPFPVTFLLWELFVPIKTRLVVLPGASFHPPLYTFHVLLNP